MLLRYFVLDLINDAENCINKIFFILLYRIKECPEDDNIEGSNVKDASQSNDAVISGQTTVNNGNNDNTFRKITRNQKRRHDEINHVQKVNTFFSYPFFFYLWINFFELDHYFISTIPYFCVLVIIF